MRYQVVILLLLTYLQGFAAEGTALLQEGNQAYEEANYEMALEHYLTIAETYESSALYYNIGNAYYKLSDVPHAILYYERALRLNPANEDIKANLALAYKRTIDKIEWDTEGFTEWWNIFLYGKPLTFWSNNSLWLMLMGFMLFTLFILAKKKLVRQLSFFAGLIAVGCSILAVFAARAQQSYITNENEAVIVALTVNAKGAPSTDATNVFVLHEGTKVMVKEAGDQWYEITIPNGSVGWVKSETLEVI